MRWGLAGGTTLASLAEVREVARYAVAAGFDSLWISHANAVDPIVALACTAEETAGLVEVGTSVVPLYGRHPIGLAQLARTAQSALDGRFTLGIGAASRQAVHAGMGLAWERPLAYTRQFIEGLQPLLAGEQADVDGDAVTTHAVLNIAAADTPILLAALGPKMLELAGRRVRARRSDSAAHARSPPTSRRPCSPRPRRPGGPSRGSWRSSASASPTTLPTPTPWPGRPRRATGPCRRTPPCRTWRASPNRPTCTSSGPGSAILDGLQAYADAGVTDFRLEVAAPDDGTRRATREALAVPPRRPRLIGPPAVRLATRAARLPA